MNDRDVSQAAMDVLERCDALAACTDEAGKVTRTFLARPAVEQVHGLVRGWMEGAGLRVCVDGLGNISGRREGVRAGAPALLIGSHLDTVPDAGRYDGVLGVMLGLKVAELLRETRLAIGLEVVGFSEEEGVRFRTPYIGSTGFVGRLGPETLELCGADGRSVREVARAFGCSGEAGVFDAGRYLGYLEAHIEQGPVLESMGLPLGVVTGIVGQSRVSVTVSGRAAHAGTTPMHLRRDALVAAAEFVGEVNEVAGMVPGLVATVGRMEVRSGASNVVPGVVELSVDVRHEQDEVRRGVVTGLMERGRAIAEEQGCGFEYRVDGDFGTVPMDVGWVENMAQACAAAGVTPHRMSSGAGHDAAVLAGVMPACMLFLRSPGGVSHHPDEAVIREDVELAIKVMVEFVGRAAASYDASRSARA